MPSPWTSFDPSQAESAPRGAFDAEAFLARLFRHGIRVSAAGGRLRCAGPAELLTGQLGAEIRARKPEILAFLDRAAPAPQTDSPIPPRGAAPLPLTAAQARLWALERMQPEAAHHIPFAIEAEGALDEAALLAALTRVAARHETLRLRIEAAGGLPRPRIAPQARIPLRRAHPADAAAEAALIREEAARPFDLAADPPIRLCLAPRGEGRTLVLVTLHHIAADGGSVAILMEEVSRLYAAEIGAAEAPDLPPLPVQYGDHAAWTLSEARQAAEAADLAFWRERLTDLPVTRLPADLPRPPVQSLAAARHPLALPAPLVERLRALGAAQGASLFAVLLTGVLTLAHRWTGERELVVGTPVSTRSRPELEGLIGLFVNPLPLRSQISPAQGFAANLARVRDDLLDATEHGRIPFERLAEAFQRPRDPGASPLFQLKFQLDRAPREAWALPGLTLRRLPLPPGPARHDLSLDLVDGPGGVAGHIDYCRDLFRPGTVAAFADHLQRLLTSAAEAPERPVALLDMLSPAEIRRELVEWNDTAREIDPTERFPALFEAWAARTPDAPAVEVQAGGETRIESYAALDARANRLAHRLRALGIGRDDVVGIALERGADMVAAWLAVLKAGAAYLPLDPAYPADRLAWMLSDSGARLVLTASGIALPGAAERIDLDLGWPEGDETRPEPARDPQDLAYLIYTSGSTGRPKGVEVPHAGLVNLARDKIAMCGTGPGDRVMSFFSFSFDASIPDLAMSLGAGATLLLAPARDLPAGAAFADALRERRATHLTITPSALASLPEADLPDLRLVLVGGEAPSRELVERWSAGRRFINAYGPTECTVNASMVPLSAEAPDPVLRAPANKRLHVLDAQLGLLPPGAPGELCVAGLGLARGYRGRPGATAAVFVPDPWGAPGARLYRTGDRAVRLGDGSIRLLGRLDDQIKLRGHRIEPAEIARACESHPAVEAAAVVPREVDGRTRLVAYLVASGGAEEALRSHLLARLPRHMIPDALVRLDRLPLSPTGKLDLQALPAPEPRARRGRPPRGEAERAVAALFSDLLGVADPGAEDDFFDLGGDSLLATRLVAAIEAAGGAAPRLRDLFENSTVEALARRISGETAEASGAEPWREDLPLDPALRLAPGVAPRAGLPGPVLLTGATGFVGVHLLAELLADPGRAVLCLSRRGGDPILAALKAHWLLRPGMEARIATVTGDLCAPNLGLSPPDRARVAACAAILHCGAEVHHIRPYRALRGPNVEGTRALLRLAAETGAAFHHISTLSAVGAAAESDAAADRPPPDGGYNLSKWVAERLAAEARARGLAVAIYRLGAISGHSRTGAFNPADILGLRLRGYLASGLAPAGEARMTLLPVDHAARALLHLAADPTHAGRVFHLTHSTPVSTERLFEACAAEGRPIRRLAPAEWRSHMARIARAEPDHPLHRLAALGPGEGFGNGPSPACAQTRAALDPHLPEPPLDQALLRRYVRACLAANGVPDHQEAAR